MSNLAKSMMSCLCRTGVGGFKDSKLTSRATSQNKLLPNPTNQSSRQKQLYNMLFSNMPKFSLIRRNRKKKTAVARESALAVLPSKLKQRLVSFLPVRELLNLVETSKSKNSDLNINVASSPLTDQASQDKNY